MPGTPGLSQKSGSDHQDGPRPAVADAPGELEIPVQVVLLGVVEWELEHVVAPDQPHHVLCHLNTRKHRFMHAEKSPGRDLGSIMRSQWCAGC